MEKLLIAAMLVLAGCGTGPAAGQASHSYRLFVEKMGGTELSIVTTSAAAPLSLPGGYLTADGSQVFTPGGQVFGGPAGAGGKTVISVFDPRSGALARKLEVAGAWSWDGSGTSPDGRWVVLTGPSGFVVVDTTSGRQYPVGVKRNFSFDAISNDGHQLYLIETLAGGAYQVRLYQVFSNTLQVDPVLIKGPEVEAMNGYKITAVADPDGHMLYSLYGRNDGRPPFVHALDLVNAVAFCIDLPALTTNGGNHNLDAATSGWALSLDASRHRLYASSALGQVAKIDTQNYVVVRSSGLKAPAVTSLLPSFLVDATAKEFEGAPAASAVDPSGRWLYVAWESGYLAVDTGTLRPAALRDRDDHLSSLALSPDGRHLFAVSSSGSDRFSTLVIDLDPRTGTRQATIGGITAPWRILRLEASV